MMMLDADESNMVKQRQQVRGEVRRLKKTLSARLWFIAR
jgi:hypothetical protein